MAARWALSWSVRSSLVSPAGHRAMWAQTPRSFCLISLLGVLVKQEFLSHPFFRLEKCGSERIHVQMGPGACCATPLGVDDKGDRDEKWGVNP